MQRMRGASDSNTTYTETSTYFIGYNVKCMYNSAKGGVGGGGGDLIQTFCETDHSLFGYVTFIINAHPKSHESY